MSRVYKEPCGCIATEIAAQEEGKITFEIKFCSEKIKSHNLGMKNQLIKYTFRKVSESEIYGIFNLTPEQLQTAIDNKDLHLDVMNTLKSMEEQNE